MTYRETFARDGFLIVPGLISRDECAALKQEIQSVLAQRGDHGGVFVGLSAANAACRDLMRDPRLLEIVAQIWSPDIEFLSDKVVFKSQATSYASPWHQDWPYWRGAHKLSIWLALDDATIENGCMKLLPGSHEAERLHDAGPTESGTFGNSVRPETVDEARAVNGAVSAGGAVFFHDLTLHASHPNVTGADRFAWIGTYRDARADDLAYDWAVAAEVVRGSRA